MCSVSAAVGHVDEVCMCTQPYYTLLNPLIPSSNETLMIV